MQRAPGSKIRLASPADAAAMRAIYAPAVDGSTVSFELALPTVAQLAARVAQTLPARPWLVYEEQGCVLGYAYAARHRERAAYQWCVETSVYVDERARGQGVGTALYGALFALLRAQGFTNAYAVVTLPNEASVGLHRACGFEELTVYRRVGFKLGRWLDVWWGFLDLLPERGDEAPALRSVDELAREGRLEALLVSEP
jgi:L-amino acid N-acyltransferase YncA